MKIIKHLLLLSVVLMLCGCAVSPEQLGISAQEWNNYGKAKQQKLLTAYENARQTESEEDAKYADAYASLENKTYNGPLLSIRIYGGEAMLPPFTAWQSYKLMEFDVLPDTCLNTPVLARGGEDEEGNPTVNLRVCYQNNVLLVDTARALTWEKDGAIRLPYSPLWDNGFTYKNISTDGVVKFKNVTVAVLAMQGQGSAK